MSWSTFRFYEDSDLQDFETGVLNRLNLGNEVEKYHGMVKQEIELRLWRHFHDLEPDTFAMLDDLNCLRNPEILKHAGIFLAFHFIFRDFIKSPDDVNEVNSNWYFQRYDVEFIRVLPLIIVQWPDVDLSGQIIESEEWGILRRW